MTVVAGYTVSTSKARCEGDVVSKSWSPIKQEISDKALLTSVKTKSVYLRHHDDRRPHIVGLYDDLYEVTYPVWGFPL